MFHFPRFARARLWIQRAVRRHYPPWVSPFGHLRIKAWLAAPRSLSQLPASFIASCRLGIHRVPLVAWSSSLLAPASAIASLHEDQGPARSLCAGLTTQSFRHTHKCLLVSCAYAVVKDRKSLGGADRDRTDDFQLAKLALSQLSYGPFITLGTPSLVSPLPLLTWTTASWWAWIDLNYRPHAYQACALTN